MSISYKDAGVDIEAGNQAVDRIKTSAASTFSTGVLSGLGSFGSFYDLKEVLETYDHPVMVQSIDGVGTKIMIAKMMNDFTHVGRDLVSACCNDIIVHGARPVTFLDYIANDRLDPLTVSEMVESMAAGCREAGVSLVGGETAEMPGTYREGEHDLAGIVTGFVERAGIINGQEVSDGDVIIGIPSSGLHTNGYSLARKVLFDHAKLDVADHLPKRYEQTRSIGELLLEAHTNYTAAVHALLATDIEVRSMSHITGGGLIENVPRTLPEGMQAVIDTTSWKTPAIFEYIASLGDIAPIEQYHAFNMGIGYTIIVPETQGGQALRTIARIFDTDATIIGRIRSGKRSVELTGLGR